jgi:hypothetical protein
MAEAIQYRPRIEHLASEYNFSISFQNRSGGKLLPAIQAGYYFMFVWVTFSHF